MVASRDIKVGLFVLVGLVASSVVIFLIGDQRNIFARKVDYSTTFRDVQGLAPGAPVRMDGITVGAVTDVRHAENLSDPQIHVDLWIIRSESLRIRANASAKVANKGLLGDKMIEISPGSNDQPVLKPGAIIHGEPPTDYGNYVRQIGKVIERSDTLLSNLNKISKGIATPQVQQDIQSSIHSVSIILKQTSQGNGYAHKLLTDPQEAERISHSLANLDKTTTQLALASAELNMVLQRVNRGPGLAHDLVYSNRQAKPVEQLGNAAEELTLTLQGIRQGDGIAHAALYGGEKNNKLLGNLTHASGDLKVILSDVRQGKGTLGALLVDPSVYEDLKMVLGNVQRNRSLRAIVRYSIQQDEKTGSVQVKDPGKGSDSRSPHKH